jgi:2-polyprenyl-6-methoxyphenol hydroxylase-like FAD-dependent oxidoreductase
MRWQQMHNDRMTVLGAGLQGVCVALALAQLGYRVNHEC